MSLFFISCIIKKNGGLSVRVELSFTEFFLSIGLFLLSLIVAYGLRKGLYVLAGWFYGYLPTVLREDITPMTMRDTNNAFRTLVLFLDPLLSWFSAVCLILIFLFYLAIDPNLYIQTLVLYLIITMGFIFPWRLFVRIYQWLKSFYMKQVNQQISRLSVVGLFSLFGALVLYYIFFFIVLFGLGGTLHTLYELFDPALQTLTQQIYIQHVQAYIPVLSIGAFYLVYDLLRMYFVK